MPTSDGRVVRLTDERLRRLERRMAAVEAAQRSQRTLLDESIERLDQAVDVLIRLVRIVATQNRRLTRSFAQVNARLDRTTRAILKGRTADQRRMLQLERRVAALERRLPRAGGA
jgi:hypothetical protein